MNVQFRETDNITYTRRKMKEQSWMYNSEKLTPLRIQDGRWKQNKQKKKIKNTHNTICVGHHYAQAKTNYVNKTWALLQTTHDYKRAVVRFICIAKEQKNIMRYYINLPVIILFKWIWYRIYKSIYNGTN
jgi:C4-dicarboxylate-specific signal transduction histidine kinase